MKENNNMKTLSKAIALASLVSATALTAQVAQAEVEYSAGIATTYLWRGTDLGGAAFSAAADYSHDSGLYAGLWASSGDAATGNEYDLYVGYGMEMGDFSVDLSVATYIYNNNVEYDAVADEMVDAGLGSPGELSEAILGLGYGDASLTYIDNLGDETYSYLALGYSVAGADLTYGMSDDDGAKYSHIDVSYGLTDELGITVSKPIDDTAGVDEDVIVVMSYSIALK
jgi:uncharacterized protein (TIGR02001 family)